MTAGGSAGIVAGVAAPAFSDSIDDAAKAFADATYPVMEKIDWERTPQLTKWIADASKSWDPKLMAMATDRVLEAGLAADPRLIMAAVSAHDKALDDAIGRPGNVLPLNDHEDVTVAIARMIASMPNAKVMAIYDAFSAAGTQTLWPDFYNSLSRADVDATYKAFLELAQAVKV